MLKHHHRIIDHQADGCGHAAERHHVETHPEQGERNAGRRQHRWQHQGDDQHETQTAQEDEQHHARQQGAEQYRVPHAAGGRRDQLRLIVEGHDANIVRGLGLEGRDPASNLLDETHAVGVRRLANVEQDRILPLGCDPGPLRGLPNHHFGDVVEFDHAAGAGLDHGPADVVDARQLIVGQDQIQTVAVFQTTGGHHHIVGGENAGQILHR